MRPNHLSRRFIALPLAALLLAADPGTVLAQGGGGGGGGGSRGGATQTMTGRGDMDTTRAKDMTRSQDRDRIHQEMLSRDKKMQTNMQQVQATKNIRERLRLMENQTEMLRKQMRKMRQIMETNGAGSGQMEQERMREMTRQMNELNEQMRLMNQEMQQQSQ